MAKSKKRGKSARHDKLEANLKALHESLESGLALYRNSPNGGRNGICSQLEIAIEVVETFGQTRTTGLLTPLRQLLAGLQDLNSGETMSFLQPAPTSQKSKGGQPGPGQHERKLRGWAAGTFKRLLSEGMQPTDAAGRIKRAMKKPSPSLRTLRLWQTEARKNKSSVMGKAYMAALTQNFEVDDGTSKTSTMIEVLKHLDESARF